MVEQVTVASLTAALTRRFGPVKDVKIVQTKKRAFIEFLSLDLARRAITASLPQDQGGEGGLFIDVGGETGQVRILVKTHRFAGRPSYRK